MLNYYDPDFTFPIDMNRILAEDSSKLTEISESAEQVSQRKPHCLIFAADENIRFLFRTLLEIWNYEVKESTSREEIIRQAEGNRPDIVLMDTPINFSDSLQLMQALKAVEPLNGVPFVLLSGHAQPAIRRAALAAGAAALCVKPVDFKSLEHALRNCLDG